MCRSNALIGRINITSNNLRNYEVKETDIQDIDEDLLRLVTCSEASEFSKAIVTYY